MKRRSFLAALCAAPFVPKAAAGAANTFEGASDMGGGVPRTADADIGTLQAGVLHSKDRRLTIDLSTGTILIS